MPDNNAPKYLLLEIYERNADEIGRYPDLDSARSAMRQAFKDYLEDNLRFAPGDPLYDDICAKLDAGISFGEPLDYGVEPMRIWCDMRSREIDWKIIAL